MNSNKIIFLFQNVNPLGHAVHFNSIICTIFHPIKLQSFQRVLNLFITRHTSLVQRSDRGRNWSLPIKLTNTPTWNYLWQIPYKHNSDPHRHFVRARPSVVDILHDHRQRNGNGNKNCGEEDIRATT